MLSHLTVAFFNYKNNVCYFKNINSENIYKKKTTQVLSQFPCPYSPELTVYLAFILPDLSGLKCIPTWTGMAGLIVFRLCPSRLVGAYISPAYIFYHFSLEGNYSAYFPPRTFINNISCVSSLAVCINLPP